MPSSSFKRLLLAGAFAAATVAALPAHAAYSGIVFFGDSLSDTGNIWYATGGFPPAPYYQGTSGGAQVLKFRPAGQAVSTPTRCVGP